MEFHIVINLKWFRRISKPKKSTIIFGTEHVKLGLVKNCLNLIDFNKAKFAFVEKYTHIS